MLFQDESECLLMIPTLSLEQTELPFQVPFALWMMSLLINSNTIEEMSALWERICVVLLSPTGNLSYSLSMSRLSAAADNISKDPNKENFILKNVQVNSGSTCQYSTTHDQVEP